jgi:hypothetical protein
MATGRPSGPYDRVVQPPRCRRVGGPLGEAEGLSTARIAERLGCAPATITAIFYDPTGEKARAVKAR